MKRMLRLEGMTVLEKLAALEQIWESLSAAPGLVPSPEWHGRVLAERAEGVRRGKSRFRSLAEVKRRLRRRRK